MSCVAAFVDWLVHCIINSAVPKINTSEISHFRIQNATPIITKVKLIRTGIYYGRSRNFGNNIRTIILRINFYFSSIISRYSLLRRKLYTNKRAFFCISMLNTNPTSKKQSMVSIFVKVPYIGSWNWSLKIQQPYAFLCAGYKFHKKNSFWSM